MINWTARLIDKEIIKGKKSFQIDNTVGITWMILELYTNNSNGIYN